MTGGGAASALGMLSVTSSPRASVVDAFPLFTERFEGRCNWMYLDVKGLVTTGRGNLIDPLPAALFLPWVQAFTPNGGSPASAQQVADEWHRVKACQAAAHLGGGSFKRMTTLRLTDADVDALTKSKMLEMWRALVARGAFASAKAWPAAAQLGLLSMAWAMGPAFNFPKFELHAVVPDFTLMAAQCGISTAGNPGVAARNAANVGLFLTAAAVSGQPERFDVLPSA